MRSVSCHHFGWALPGSGKRRFDEGLPKKFQTCFFDFPHGGQTKKHSLERFERGWFHATILGGHFQVAPKGGFTKVVQTISKRVFSTFPMGPNKKTLFGTFSTRSVSCHHFGWALPGSGKRWFHEGRQNEFKTRFFHFSHWRPNEKTLFETFLTRSVSCHHLGFFCTSGLRQLAV